MAPSHSLPSASELSGGLETVAKAAQLREWSFNLQLTLFARASVSLFNMLTGHETRVLSVIFPLSKEVATENAPEYVKRL